MIQVMNFTNKTDALGAMQGMYVEWRWLLSDMNDGLANWLLRDRWTYKDEVVHLWQWQKLSVAWLEAFYDGSKLGLSYWPDWFDHLSESEEDVERINKWVHEKFIDIEWDYLYQQWNMTFGRALELYEHVSEKEYFAQGKFPWLGEYTMMDVLQGSYNHYEEHLEQFEKERVRLVE